MDHQLKIAIIGGGIGGLSAAVCLEREGFTNVKLFERASEFSEIGAGIQVSNNGVKIFRHLGLDTKLEATACRSDGNVYFDIESGERILETVAGVEGERLYGAPFFHIKRTALLDVLKNAVKTTQFVMNANVLGVEDTGDGAIVTVENMPEEIFDVVIAADGIKSTLRAQFVGREDPEFSGYLAWRGLIPAEKLEGADLPRRCTAWWGPERGGVIFWVDGGAVLNFVGTVPSAQIKAEDWDKAGLVEDLRRSYAGCTEPLSTVIEAIDEPFVTGIFSREVLDVWHNGRTVFLGDACHPIWPFLANGATMAVEDSYVLARCLARSDDLTAAFEEYQARRKDRVSDVSRASREMGRAYHMEGSQERQARNESMRTRAETDPQGVWLRGWLWGYDAISDTETPLADRSPKRAPKIV